MASKAFAVIAGVGPGTVRELPVLIGRVLSSGAGESE